MSAGDAPAVETGEAVEIVEPGATLAAIGVDAGSTTCKVVAVDEADRLVAWSLAPMSPRVADQAASMIAAVAQAVTGSEDASDGPPAGIPVYATGYGRKLVASAAAAVTEITCHARGVHAATGTSGTLVDIGGQDSKVIRIGANGAAIDFAMNDKCAAGTGRFLEHTAHRLGLGVEEMGPLAVTARAEGRVATVTSTCTVFAESEVISLVADGAEVDAILAGLHTGLVSRILTMARTVGIVPPLLLSGGVARNAGVVDVLRALSGVEVRIPPHPQLMGAYGAALLAASGSRAPAEQNVPVVGRDGCAACEPDAPPTPTEAGSGRPRLRLPFPRRR